MSAPEMHIPTNTHSERRLFYVVGGLFLAAFLGWGLFARLNAGAVAQGEVIPAGRVKTIQHLEGGIIRAIRVQEGDAVKAGTELMALDETEARAQLAVAETELAAQEAMLARLEAERDDRAYQPPPGLAASPSVLAQMRLFESRRETLNKELAGLDERLVSLRKETQSWEAKEKSLSKLRANADEETRINQRLYQQNFISKPRLLQLESQRADSAARFSENSAEIARARQRIADTEIAIAKLKNERMNSLLEDLRRAEEGASAAREKAGVARDRLARTRVVAPQDGLVNGLKFSTVGGVVPPGGAILDVVPVDEPLVVEARILPDDIDVVATGRPARVKLTAYKARSHISLVGKVVQVSGSTFRDDAPPRQTYYKARVEIAPGELGKVERGVLIPGMLAQVEIDAGDRSAIRYLLDPVIESFGRAFRES